MWSKYGSSIKLKKRDVGPKKRKKQGEDPQSTKELFLIIANRHQHRLARTIKGGTMSEEKKSLHHSSMRRKKRTNTTESRKINPCCQRTYGSQKTSQERWYLIAGKKKPGKMDFAKSHRRILTGKGVVSPRKIMGRTAQCPRQRSNTPEQQPGLPRIPDALSHR